jgi:hypothetical protein
MKKAGLGVAFATLLLAATIPLRGAHAVVVYSEDFNSGFQGSALDLSKDPVGNKSDRYDPTYYYTINNADSWTFSGSAYFALGGGTTAENSTNGAVLLNETTGVGTTVVGLSTGQTYALSFNYWGDNRPGQSYSLLVYVNGILVDTINDTDGAPGSNPTGTIVTINGLTTVGGNLTLLFAQASGSQASPIFDDVQISATPLPAALPLFASGLGALGLLGWRRKRKAQAARAAA